MGFELDAVTMDGAIERIAQSVGRAEGGWVITPNLDILRQIITDAEVRSLAGQTTLRLADGMPLVWASRLRRTPLPERVAGSDLIFPLCARAAREGWTVFLLGGNPGAAVAAADVLRQRSPGVQIVGCECPALGFENDPSYLTHLESTLRTLNPTLVFVALGAPKQERLIARLRPTLPGAWFFGIGVTFSFVSGEIARAPLWMRGVGLEWLHRLAHEPRRLARRYLALGLPFGVRLLVRSIFEGARTRTSASTIAARP